MRDFIQLQNDYHRAFLVVKLKDITLNDLKKKLEVHVQSYKDRGNENIAYDRDVGWDGNWKSYKRLMAEYNVDAFQFNQDIATLNKLRDKLLVHGLDNNDLQDILNGKYITEMKYDEKNHKVYKEQISNDGIENKDVDKSGDELVKASEELHN